MIIAISTLVVMVGAFVAGCYQDGPVAGLFLTLIGAIVGAILGVILAVIFTPGLFA